jgi:hypothetical protein
MRCSVSAVTTANRCCPAEIPIVNPILIPTDSCQSTARAPKARGVKLGGHAENLKIAELGRRKAAARTADLIPVIEAIRAEGISAAVGIAKALNDRGIPTTRGCRWQAVQVQRVLKRAGAAIFGGDPAG